MAETVKVLGQISGGAAASSYQVLYACPTATQAVVSTLAVCNTASTSATYRVAVSTASASPVAKEFLVFGATVNGNDTVFLTLGATLTATEKFLNVSSSASTVSFSAFGVEIA